MLNLWWVPADHALEGLPEARAGEIVDKEVDGGTHVGEELGQSQQKVEGVGEVSASPQSQFEYRQHAQADDGDGQQEELDGQSDELLVTPISLLDKLEDVWLRQRTVWMSLKEVILVAINTTTGQPTVRKKP